jgi:hypothetical protein
VTSQCHIERIDFRPRDSPLLLRLCFLLFQAFFSLKDPKSASVRP